MPNIEILEKDEREETSVVPVEDVVVSDPVNENLGPSTESVVSPKNAHSADRGPVAKTKVKDSAKKASHRPLFSDPGFRSLIKQEVAILGCRNMESYIRTAVLYYIKHARKTYYDFYCSEGLIDVKK